MPDAYPPQYEPKPQLIKLEIDIKKFDFEGFRQLAFIAIDQAGDNESLVRVKAHYGPKGSLKDLEEQFTRLPKEEKPAIGKLLNLTKRSISDHIAQRQAALQSQPAKKAGFYDFTLPGAPLARGSLHPLTIVTEELLEVFGRLGFRQASGPEVEVPFYNFQALNIPPDHPAREDPSENFFLTQTAQINGREEPLLLRSQTSTIQVRELERVRDELARGVPLRIVGPGRVFRPDEVDATHHFQFHQIEGLAVEEGLSFADLKTVLTVFARELFGTGDVRLRPSFFPFTEPSAEVDFLCWSCGGAGCPLCKKSGWIEVGGCGMVDPNVFDALGIDSERFTGYAFGFGIERIAMRRLGIMDVRLFTENDVRFLEQFQ